MAPPALVYAIPAIQLVCNLVMPGVTLVNDTNSAAVVEQTTTPIPLEIVNLPAGYVPYFDVGAAYKVYDESAPWRAGRERCIKDGASLAVIDNSVKLDYLLNQAAPIEEIHVGIHRMYDGQEWFSTTTWEALQDLPWANFHPFGITTCVAASFQPRGLRNLACVINSAYACEIPITGNYNAKNN